MEEATEATEIFNPIVDGGLIDDIMTAFGLITDFDITSDYHFLYMVLGVSLSLIFIVLFVVLLLRCMSAMFKGARL